VTHRITVPEADSLQVAFLEPRIAALAMVAAAVCLDADIFSYRKVVETALEAGAKVEECIGAYLAVAAAAGTARMVEATPLFAFAMGYDIDEALEIL
jgi:hypothetical protein